MPNSERAGLGTHASKLLHDTVAAAEEVSPPAIEYFHLYLYIAGMSPKSVKALERIREICANYLDGRNVLKIIDIYQQPHLAREANIVAVPTLVKIMPLPERRVIGDLSNIGQVLCYLGINEECLK